MFLQIKIILRLYHTISCFRTYVSTFHLAGLYGIEPRVLVQAIKRSIERFPEDFMFQLVSFLFSFTFEL